jgi:para-nitrobenzyl esterase
MGRGFFGSSARSQLVNGININIKHKGHMNPILQFTLASYLVVYATGCTSNNPGPLVASDTDAIVSTQSGIIAGYVDNGINVFKGVPYAKSERFMPPENPDSWKDTLACRTFGPKSPQSLGYSSDFRSNDAFVFKFNKEDEDEKDLLCLNIWTPGLNDGKKRPVFIWFHGGGYFAGSGNNLNCYDGRSLAEKGDIVVVNLNHRLNILGFLDLSSLGDKYARSANVSVLDMIASLKWIHNNISQFGGDPGNITIAGQSGGGGKVMTLLVAPAAKGLFHKAIIQSGTIRALKMPTKEQTTALGNEVIGELGISKESEGKIRDLPVSELQSAALKAIMKGGGSFMSLLLLGPSVDGDVLPYEHFSADAKELYKDIPVMIGSTLNEMGQKYYGRDINMEQAKEILQERYNGDAEKFADAFSRAYPAGTPQDLISADVDVRQGVIDRATQIYDQGGAPVYLYLFAWKSPVLDGIYGSCHNMELPFMFNNVALQRELTGSTKEAYILADKMSSAWINFIRNGNPNGKGIPRWDVFKPETNATMTFDNRCELKINHDKELLQVAAEHPAPGPLAGTDLNKTKKK